MSKHKQIEQHLINKGSITPLQALSLYGVYRLSSVIHRLRNKGYMIATVMQERHGDVYARYELV